VATVRRISSDGSLIGDTTALTLSEIDGSTMAVSPDGSKVYVWHPIERTLTRIDTSTGTQDDVRAADPSALASPDLLGQLGQWLVPSTEAKMFLQSGVALSPDGSTLYALGVTAFDRRGDAGSTGIYAVKLGATMEIDNWSPAADLVSIAVSNDGRYVYAAGMPGVDANGDATGQPASVSVYDATTGAVTYTAGQLGDSLLTFASRLLN